MKNLTFLSVSLLLLTFLVQCNQPKSKDNSCLIEVKNPSPVDITDAVIEIPVPELAKYINLTDSLKLMILQGNEMIASEIINPGKTSATLLALINIKANQTLTFEIKQVNASTPERSITKRTQAELSIREGGSWKMITKADGKQQYEYEGGQFKNVLYLKVPKEHTDHSYYIRYEGPGWESDKVAYRFYLDWRNANDIFGKLTPEVVLHRIGIDGIESYHDKTDWGMDIFKVAESLGIGSIAYWDGQMAKRVEKTDSIDCRIAINGNLMSMVETNYYGWQADEYKTNLNSRISITAGSRISKVELSMDKPLPMLCTGIIKHEGIEAESNFNDPASDWIYLSTYGVQSLANDKLGLAVIAERKYFQQLTTDALNHLLILKPIDGKLIYYFLAAWEEEYHGISNKQDFDYYINQLIGQMNEPIKITVKKQNP